MQLEFSEYGDLLSMLACLPACEEPQAVTQRFTSYRGFVSINRDSDGLFTFERNDGDHSIEIEFRNLVSGDARRWRIPHQGYLLGLELSRPQNLSMASGEGFQPRESSGFSAWFERLRYLQIFKGRVEESSLHAGRTLDAAGQHWAGYRNRFWAAMIRPGQDATITSRAAAGQSEAQLDLYSDSVAPLRFTVYAGPVESHSLESANADLGSLKHAGLYPPGWLTRGLDSALKTFFSLLQNAGASVVLLALLSLAVLWPLYRYTEKALDSVHKTGARMKPRVKEIRNRFTGRERTERLKALYRQENLHPLYRLKGLVGLLLLLAGLWCTYKVLANDMGLLNARFLWIPDLSLPDGTIELPWNIPLLGEYVNLLPVVMASLVMAAAWVRRRRMAVVESAPSRTNHYWFIPALFLLVFYTLPAGMVLFWTTIFAVIFISRVLRIDVSTA